VRVPSASRGRDIPPHLVGAASAANLLPLPLRRQGGAGRGWPWFGLIPKAPLPNPPLPSQGRERELAAEAAPTRAPPAARRADLRTTPPPAVRRTLRPPPPRGPPADANRPPAAAARAAHAPSRRPAGRGSARRASRG